jgi:two-component system, OmpR family, KDP operon response regulator KdpE
MEELSAAELGRVLVLDEDEELARSLQRDLELEGYQVEWVDDGLEGLERAREPDIDLLVLELVLPELEGIRLLRLLRRGGSQVPALVLSSRTEEVDAVLALRSGADDFVRKPFRSQELVARLEALRRRARGGLGGFGLPSFDPRGNGARRETAAPSGVATWAFVPPEPGPRSGRFRAPETGFSFGRVEVDLLRRVVRKAGREVPLTPKEFDLLVALLARGGAAASREELLLEVWHRAPPAGTRTVDTHVFELRRKLEDIPASPRFLLTVRKVGYRLEGG